MQRVPGLVFRYALPFLAFSALLTYPLWLYRIAYPGAWPEVVQAARGSAPMMGSLQSVEGGVIGFALKLIGGVTALSLLPGIAISRLTRTSHPWPEALAIGIPHSFYGSFIVVTLGFWVGLGSGFAGIGLFGIDFKVAGVFGAALVFLAIGQRAVSKVGDVIRVQGRGLNPHQPRVYRGLIAVAVLPLVLAYLTAVWWTPLVADGELLRGRSASQAFALVGLIEAFCLVAACITWGAAWHLCYATTSQIDTEAVAEAFA